MTSNTKILMVGCGKMGGALLRQWVDIDGLEFTVVDPFVKKIPNQARLLRSQGDMVGETFDAIIIAVKPQLIMDVMPVYEPFLNENGCVISIAAGYAIGSIKSIWDDKAIIRIMPNLPAFIGQGVSGLVADDVADQAQKDLVETLANQVGQSIWVENEDMIDRLTAVSGSGPGYIFEMARVYAEAAKSLGFDDEQARFLVLGTMLGTTQMALDSSETLEDLRNSVTSKKGTTDAGLKALNADGQLTELLEDTLKAAYQRAVELR